MVKQKNFWTTFTIKFQTINVTMRPIQKLLYIVCLQTGTIGTNEISPASSEGLVHAKVFSKAALPAISVE